MPHIDCAIRSICGTAPAPFVGLAHDGARVLHERVSDVGYDVGGFLREGVRASASREIQSPNDRFSAPYALDCPFRFSLRASDSALPDQGSLPAALGWWEPWRVTSMRAPPLAVRHRVKTEGQE